MIIKLRCISLNFIAIIFKGNSYVPSRGNWVVRKKRFHCGKSLIFYQTHGVLIIIKSYFIMTTILFKRSWVSSRLCNLTWLLVKQSSSLSGCCSAGTIPYMGACFFFFAFGTAKVAKTVLLFLWPAKTPVVIVLIVQILTLEEATCLVVIMGDMVIQVAPIAAVWARVRMGLWAIGDLEWERLLFLDKMSTLNKEEWSLCTTLSSSFWSNHVCILHLSSRRTFSCSPSLCNESYRGVDHHDGDCYVIFLCNCISYFDGSCSSCDDDAGGSSHSWQATGRWAVFFSFGFFFSLSMSRTLVTLSAVWHCPKRQCTKEGPWAPFCLFPQNWTGAPLAAWERYFCFSFAVWAAQLFDRGNCCHGRWAA